MIRHGGVIRRCTCMYICVTLLQRITRCVYTVSTKMCENMAPAKRPKLSRFAWGGFFNFWARVAHYPNPADLHSLLVFAVPNASRTFFWRLVHVLKVYQINLISRCKYRVSRIYIYICMYIYIYRYTCTCPPIGQSSSTLKIFGLQGF